MDIDVTDVPDEKRFEARDPEGTLLGISMYDVYENTMAFTHTEVDESVEGKGVASRLVRASLDEARGRGHDVAALCPYVKSWIERHADYQDLLHAQD